MSRWRLILCALPVALLAMLASCNPEAPWTTKDVTVEMKVKTVSAGFIECEFSTNKEAYYYIAVEQVREDFDPMTQQKQFMTMALNNAYTDYIDWQNALLKAGEFHVAPFSSHVLQYGDVDHFFTGLLTDTKYWLYAFVVNPDKKEPVGKLNLVEVQTTDTSIINIHFAYRVKGSWDYVYPTDSLGNIQAYFPYIACTRDSAQLREESKGLCPSFYFKWWMLEQYLLSDSVRIFYGVTVSNNDGTDGHIEFEEGHTYYTSIAGYDGDLSQNTIYKFRWNGAKTEYYFVDTHPANIANDTIW